MAEYIDFEADDSGGSADEDVIMTDEDENFSDDEIRGDEEPSFYGFVNQTLDPREVLAECVAEQSELIETMEASNYQFDNGFLEEEPKIIDEFDKFKKRIKNFELTLTNPEKIEQTEQTRENSLFSALIYAIRYQKTQKKDLASDENLAEE